MVNLLEGISFLLLLFVAMPLKYAFALPMAVRVVGMLHGVLFITLLWAALRVYMEGSLPTKSLARVMGLAILPFGCVFADRILREEPGSRGETA